MPQGPRFASERTRLAVVAAAMAAVLLTSLGTAKLLILQRQRGAAGAAAAALSPTRIGELQLSVPAGWRPAEPGEALGPGRGAHAFADPADAGRTLQITPWETPVPRGPRTVFEAVLARLVTAEQLEPGTRGPTASSFRAGAMVGRVYLPPEESSGMGRDRFVAVLTEDGRRYWVLTLDQRGDERTRRRAYRGNAATFAAVWRTAADAGYRDATADDLRAAGWSAPAGAAGVAPTLVPAGYRARAVVEAVGGPLHLVPRETRRPSATPEGHGPEEPLRLLRLRSVADAGEDAGGLAPPALLASEFRRALRRDADPAAVQAENLGPDPGVPAWSVRLADGETGGLARDLWYVRLGAGRGEWLEALAEGGGDPWAEAIHRIVRALALQISEPAEPSGAGAPPGAPAVSTFAVAAQRGARLAEAATAALGLGGSGLTYWALEAGGDLAGLRVTGGADPSDDGPLRGWSRTYLAWSESQVDEAWTSRRDGRRFALSRRLVTGARGEGRPRLEKDRLERDGDRLTFIEGDSPRPGVAPPNYLPPMAGDAWPPDALGPENFPALVWTTDADGEPSPQWIERVAGDSTGSGLPDGDAEADGEETRPAGPIMLSVRPLAGLDAETVVLDADGRVVWREAYDPRGAPTGPRRVRYRRMSREEILKAYPALEPRIQVFEDRETPP